MLKRSILGASLLLIALASPAGATEPGLVWNPCGSVGNGGRVVECASLDVPLDHAKPDGEKISLALTRLVHTDDAHYAGVVVANPGGPGASGLGTAIDTSLQLPSRIAARYDWIGFDPRGVGHSRPSLTCDPGYLAPGVPRPDYVPKSVGDEQKWLRRAKSFAEDCGRRYGALLPHLGTEDSAWDLDAIRAALGVEKINYYGYSYGTYLGSVYATLFPSRIERMVLDGVVKPSEVWYQAQLQQNKAFEKRLGQFFTWIANHEAAYGMGRTARQVELAYYAVRDALAGHPVGWIGPSELDDAILDAGYTNQVWPSFAAALSSWTKGDRSALIGLVQPTSAEEQNSFTMYNAVQCRDASWPKDWETWRADAGGQYASGVRYNTWSNVWYNAPCLFWPVPGGPAPAPGGTEQQFLLAAATDDAATPYPGALEMHERFPRSRLIVEEGGGNHAASLTDGCMRTLISAYLDDGALPAQRKGPDATCSRQPAPKP